MLSGNVHSSLLCHFQDTTTRETILRCFVVICVTCVSVFSNNFSIPAFTRFFCLCILNKKHFLFDCLYLSLFVWKCNTKPIEKRQNGRFRDSQNLVRHVTAFFCLIMGDWILSVIKAS